MLRWQEKERSKTKPSKKKEKHYVNFNNYIWCKVCAKHKDVIMKDPTVKGSIKTSAKAFIDGTNMVTFLRVLAILFNLWYNLLFKHVINSRMQIAHAN